jgi:hypothetical protein
MRPPIAWVEKFAYEHPTLAALIAAFGFTMLGFVLALVFMDWRR